jgi:hypothetical protein
MLDFFSISMDNSFDIVVEGYQQDTFSPLENSIERA